MPSGDQAGQYSASGVSVSRWTTSLPIGFTQISDWAPGSGAVQAYATEFPSGDNDAWLSFPGYDVSGSSLNVVWELGLLSQYAPIPSAISAAATPMIHKENACRGRDLRVDGRELWTRTGATNSLIRVLAADDTGAYAVISLGDGERSLLRKYRPDGTELWSRAIEARISVAATDGSGIYVSGRDGAGAFLRKYDSGGLELWSRPIDGEAAAMAADFTGVYQAIEKTVRKHSPTGVELWTREVSGLGVLGLSLSGLRLAACGESLRHSLLTDLACETFSK